MLLWADEIGGLTLHLPTQGHTEVEVPQFYDNGSKDWRINPDHTANKLYKEFSKKKLSKDTMKLLSTAAYLGAEFVYTMASIREIVM